MEEKNIEAMEENTEATVPFYVYEGAMVRAERYFKRLLIALVISLGLLVVNNLAWMYFVNIQHPVENTIENEETN